MRRPYLVPIAIARSCTSAVPASCGTSATVAIARSSISYAKVGDILMALGKLDEALKAYRERLAIMERLAAADRSNAGWQRDLAISHGKLGLVHERQNRIADALQEFTQGRDIMVSHWQNVQNRGIKSRRIPSRTRRNRLRRRPHRRDRLSLCKRPAGSSSGVCG
jgi:tetratricopeptide (TPR) repeat protein